MRCLVHGGTALAYPVRFEFDAQRLCQVCKLNAMHHGTLVAWVTIAAYAHL